MACTVVEAAGQVPLPKPKPKPVQPVTKPVVRQGIALLSSDAACTVSIDGESIGPPLEPDEPRRVPLSEGQHVIVATAAEGSGTWRGVVDVRIGSQEVVLIPLRDKIGSSEEPSIRLPAGAKLVQIPAASFQM